MNIQVAKRLMDLKQKIESLEHDQRKAEAERDVIQAQLLKEFKVKDLASAEKLLAKEEAGIKEDEQALTKLVEEMEAKYGQSE